MGADGSSIKFLSSFMYMYMYNFFTAQEPPQFSADCEAAGPEG